MTIQRQLSLHGSLRPRAENLIRGIPLDLLHHEAHGLKHPLATYQSSLSRIEAAWHKVFPILEKLRFEVMCNVELKNYTPMLDSYETLLYRLNEHIDAAHEILRCLRPPIAGRSCRTHVDFLQQTKLPGFKTFVDAIHKVYRNPHIGMMVNEMKHASAQLRPLCARTDRRILIGFFLDGPHPDGALGPNKKVHMRFENQQTAFSLSRDMLMHFWWIYQISEMLCRCVESTIYADHGVKVYEVPAAVSNNGWNPLCLACANIETAFFLDECFKPYPIIICPSNFSSLSLLYPTARRPTPPKTMELKMLSTMTESSHSFVAPYLQARARR